MRILVTGHRGYIGTVLVPMLLSAGHDVVGLDSGLFDECVFGAQPVAIAQITRDIRDVQAEDVAGFDALMHLAALSNDPLGDLDPELTYQINHHATVKLATLAKAAGVSRFIFSSSCSTYGAGGQDWITEETPFNPVTPYGRSKVLAEQDLATLADDSFSPTYLRNATAFGVSPLLRFDLVLNNLAAWAYTTGKVFLKSDGSAWRPIVHIEDISRAFLAVLDAPRDAIHNVAFNVGRNEDNYRVRDIAEIVQSVVPNSEVSFASGASADTRNYRVDCSKIAQMLPNFQPQWNALRGAQELVEAYQKAGLQLEEFEGPRYRRIDHITGLIASGQLDATLRRSEHTLATT